MERGRRGPRGEQPLTSSSNEPPEGPAPAPIPVHTGSAVPPRRLLRGAEQLRHLLGTRLLVGITYRDPSGEIVAREQFCGRVMEVADGVVVVDRGDDPPAVLPADAPAYEPARPGRYVLSDSGDTVVDPDYVTIWDVQRNPEPDEQ